MTHRAIQADPPMNASARTASFISIGAYLPKPTPSSARTRKLCDQRGPAGLMTRADTRAVIAMEVLVEEEVIMPMRVTLHQLDTTEYWPDSVLVFQEDRGQTP